MSGINRTPTGILGFLGIKNFGRNPETVSGILSPTWDYSDWYLQTNAIFRSQAVSFNARGYFAVFAVPLSEVWTIHSLSCLAGPLIAAEAIRIHPCVADQASSVFTLCDQTTDLVSNTVGNFGVTALARRTVLGPGEVAGFFCSDLATAGAIGATAAIRYTRMQA